MYNAGQPAVEGFTNLLWTLWMAVLHLAPVPIRIVPLLVSLSGAGLLLAGVALTGALGRRLAPGEPLVPAIAMWTVAGYYPLVFWTLRGLEPGLIAVLLESAVLLAWRIRDRAPGETSTRDGMLLAGVLSAGVLTRLDFAVLAGVVLVWLLWPGAAPAGRRAAWIALGAVVLVLVAQTGFRLAYYGEALPNTYYLKVEGISLTTRLDRGSRAFGALVVSELAIVFALAGIALVYRRSARALLLALLVLAAVAYSVFVGGDAWEYLEYANRYLAPLGPLLLLLAAVGVVQVAALARSRQVVVLVGLTALVVVAATVNANIDTDPHFTLRVASLLTTLDRAHWIAVFGAAALLLAAALGARMTDNRALVIGPLVAALLLGVTLAGVARVGPRLRAPRAPERERGSRGSRATRSSHEQPLDRGGRRRQHPLLVDAADHRPPRQERSRDRAWAFPTRLRSRALEVELPLQHLPPAARGRAAAVRTQPGRAPHDPAVRLRAGHRQCVRAEGPERLRPPAAQSGDLRRALTRFSRRPDPRRAAWPTRSRPCRSARA